MTKSQDNVTLAPVVIIFYKSCYKHKLHVYSIVMVLPWLRDLFLTHYFLERFMDLNRRIIFVLVTSSLIRKIDKHFMK